jgi:hypothetical protein
VLDCGFQGLGQIPKKEISWNGSTWVRSAAMHCMASHWLSMDNLHTSPFIEAWTVVVNLQIPAKISAFATNKLSPCASPWNWLYLKEITLIF